MKPILIISSFYPPEAYSGAARPGRFGKFLPQFGYSPSVVCGNRDQHAAAPGVDRVPNASTDRPSVRTASAAGRLVERYALPYTDELPWVPHAVDAGRRIIRDRSAVAVLSTSPPLATHMAAMWLQRTENVKWIADFRDPLMGNPFRNRKWLFDYDGRLERRIFKNADFIIANTDAAATIWRKRYPQWAHKIDFIWNGFDPDEPISCLPIQPHRRKLLSHVGALYGLREPRTLMDSVDRLITNGRLDPESLCIQLIGNVESYLVRDDDPVVRRLRDLGCLSYDRRAIPQAAARQKTAESDYLLLLDSTGGLQVPAKIFDYLQAARPILAFTSRQSAVDRILQSSGVEYTGVYPDLSDTDADARIFAFLTRPPAITQPNEWFWREFDGKLHTRKLASILDSLLA